MHHACDSRYVRLDYRMRAQPVQQSFTHISRCLSEHIQSRGSVLDTIAQAAAAAAGAWIGSNYVSLAADWLGSNYDWIDSYHDEFPYSRNCRQMPPHTANASKRPDAGTVVSQTGDDDASRANGVHAADD